MPDGCALLAAAIVLLVALALGAAVYFTLAADSDGRVARLIARWMTRSRR